MSQHHSLQRSLVQSSRKRKATNYPPIYSWQYLESYNKTRKTVKVKWQNEETTVEPLSNIFPTDRFSPEEILFHVNLASKPRIQKDRWLSENPLSDSTKSLRMVMPSAIDELPLILVSAGSYNINRFVSLFESNTRVRAQKWDNETKPSKKDCNKAKVLLLSYHSSEEGGDATHPLTGEVLSRQTDLLSLYFDGKSFPALEFVFILTCAYNLIQLESLKEFSINHPTISFFFLQQQELSLFHSSLNQRVSPAYLIGQTISNCISFPDVSPLVHVATTFDSDFIQLYRPFFLYRGQKIIVTRDITLQRCAQCGSKFHRFVPMNKVSKRLSGEEWSKWAGWKATCKNGRKSCQSVFYGPGPDVVVNNAEKQSNLMRGESVAGSMSFAKRLEEVA